MCPSLKPVIYVDILNVYKDRFFDFFQADQVNCVEETRKASHLSCIDARALHRQLVPALRQEALPPELVQVTFLH